MTVKISVFAVVLILAYARADLNQESSTLSLSMPFMPYYPIDCPTFNEFKKSVYTMNQALLNLIASARSAYDYYSLYKDQQDFNLELNEKLSKLEYAKKYFESMLTKYHQSQLDFDRLLGLANTSTPSISDDISIDSNIL